MRSQYLNWKIILFYLSHSSLTVKKSLYLWAKNVNKPPLNFFYICIWLFGYKELFNHLNCGSIYKRFRWHQSIWGFSCQSIIFIIAGHEESKSFYWCYICSFFESASLYKAFSILRRSIGYFDWYIPRKILRNFLQLVSFYSKWLIKFKTIITCSFLGIIIICIEFLVHPPISRLKKYWEELVLINIWDTTY